jgi:hypothetical protein
MKFGFCNPDVVTLSPEFDLGVTLEFNPLSRFRLWVPHFFINSGEVVPCRVHQGAVWSSCTAYAACFEVWAEIYEVWFVTQKS